MRVYVSLGARRGRQMPREMPPVARFTKTRRLLATYNYWLKVTTASFIREVHPKEHRRVSVTSVAYHSIPAVRVFLALRINRVRHGEFRKTVTKKHDDDYYSSY